MYNYFLFLNTTQSFSYIRDVKSIGLPKFGSAQFFSHFEEPRTELKGPSVNWTRTETNRIGSVGSVQFQNWFILPSQWKDLLGLESDRDVGSEVVWGIDFDL